MHPILIDIPGFPITTYGLMVAIAFITFWTLAVARAKKLGYDSETIMNLLTIIVISAMVGARLLHVAVNFSDYYNDPSRLLAREGYVFLGGFLLAVASSYWYLKRKKHSVLGVADLFAPYLPLAHAIGRVGCFLYGCCWGGLCTAPWSVRFPQESPAWIDQVNRGLISIETPVTLPVHPAQLYSTLANLAIVGVLLWLRGRQSFKGQLAMMYLMLYGIARPIVEHFRVDPRGLYFGLSTSQWLGVALFAGGAIGYVILKRKGLEPDRPMTQTDSN